MSSEQKKKSSMLGSIGQGADVVVGDVLLGGIGQGAHYLARVPGVSNAMQYVGENVRDGWNKADERHQKGIAVRLVQTIAADKNTPSADEIRTMCVEAGVSDANLDAVAKAASIAIEGKEAALASLEKSKGPETTPAASPRGEVPLPSGATLQPAVG